MLDARQPAEYQLISHVMTASLTNRKVSAPGFALNISISRVEVLLQSSKSIINRAVDWIEIKLLHLKDYPETPLNFLNFYFTIIAKFNIYYFKICNNNQNIKVTTLK